MIARITGKIVEREERDIILETGGIGYRLTVGTEAISRLAEGDEITLYVYHHFSDSAQDLYGFTTKEDQKYFELLLSVPSVGPRTARNILDAAPPAVLSQAVATEDLSLLTKVSGVGKKTAQRVLIELKGKLGKQQFEAPAGSIQHETVEALISIGYTPVQARQVAGKLPKDIPSVEEAVRLALQQRA